MCGVEEGEGLDVSIAHLLSASFSSHKMSTRGNLEDFGVSAPGIPHLSLSLYLSSTYPNDANPTGCEM